MLFPKDATSLILKVGLFDDSDDPVTGIAYNDADLAVSWMLQTGTAFATATLVDGTIGTYLANSWKEIGNGIYQWCPPAGAIVSGQKTLVKIAYEAAHVRFDVIEMSLPAAAGADSNTAILAAIGALSSAGVLVVYPYNRQTAKLRLTRGSSYLAAHGRGVTFQPVDAAGNVVTNGWPDLTGATIKLGAGRDGVQDIVVGTGTVVTPTGSQLVRVEFTSAQTTVPAVSYRFELQATLGSEKIDLLLGDLIIEDGNAI